MPTQCPYFHGNSIKLRSPDGKLSEACIVDVKTKTLSCVMTVQLPTSSSPCILKLYDRRFADQMRHDEETAPWTPQIEQDYQAFVESGHQSVLFDRWASGFADDEFYYDEDCEKWDPSAKESWLQFLSLRAKRTELHAYDLMHDIQGTHVPRLLGEVALVLDKSDNSSSYFDCPGLLLQYIDGFPLTDLAQNIDRAHWQEVCDKAVETIQQTTHRGILNKDVKTRSFLVCKRAEDSPLVFMIDFGCCIFRGQLYNDQEFRHRQANQDEEGAIGLVMSRALKGGYRYRRSERALRLIFDFMRDETDPNPETWDVFVERYRKEEPSP